MSAWVSALLIDLLAVAANALERDVSVARRCLDQASKRLGSTKELSYAPPSPAVSAQIGSCISIQGMASVVGLSRSHFARTFQASFGATPHSYVTKVRIEHAKNMMLSTDEVLSQIAIACGMTDQAHFSRLFRQLAGTSPNAWRRAQREFRQLQANCEQTCSFPLAARNGVG